MTTTLRELVQSVSASAGTEVEARWIVARAAGLRDTDLLAHLDDPVNAEVESATLDMVRRLHSGEPLQYVLGSWAFRSIDVQIDSRALVPRPETEHVTGVALEELERIAAAPGSSRPARPLLAADLGTGSGVIALSLAVEGPSRLEVWATDSSPVALDLFMENLSAVSAAFAVLAHSAGLADRVHAAPGHWFGALPDTLAGKLHLVVANPPYVSEAEWRELEPVVRDHEPRDALVAGKSGLEALAELVAVAPRWLAPGGALVLELAPHQATEVTGLASDAGFRPVFVRSDLADKPRTLVARWPGD